MAGVRGFNTFHGFDNGPAPPGFPPAQLNGQGFGGFWPSQPTFGFPQHSMTWPAPPAWTPPLPAPMPVATVFQQGWGGQPGWPGQPGWGGQAHPAMKPAVDPNFPNLNINLKNHTGGFGLPPGYDYLFPAENTRIHVFKTGATPPWQLTLFTYDDSHHKKLLVPSSTTVKELMQNLGCNNDDPKKNKLYEVTEQGNGKWVKGISASGDDKDKMKKMIKDVQWGSNRTGNVGELPLVWLYMTKD
jgi:hypothetical protein